MQKISDSFEIRSAESYDLSIDSNNDENRSNGFQSVIAESQQISQCIKELILQQKRKNFISKSEQFYEPGKLMRSHSISYISHKKECLTLPYHLERLLHSHRKCPNIASDDLLDSIYGAFFGFLIGDIVGAYTAYRTYNIHEVPAALLMNGGGTYNIGPGQGTDQTEILFSAAYGLIAGSSTYNADLMAKSYLSWVESKPFNVSAIFILSLIEIKRKKAAESKLQIQGLGQILRKNSQKNKNQESNLGLVRVLPLVVWSLNLSDRQFQRFIRDELSLICPNQLVIETGLIFALMLRIIFKTRDQQLAYYEASKWVYSRGSQKLKDLWRYVEMQIPIPSRGNTGKLKTCFTYACIEINKKQVKFIESLLKTLLKGGDTDANCSIVMALVGSVTGYNNIPSYFKHKIVNSRMSQSSRPRNEEYSPYHAIEIVDELLKLRPQTYERSK